MVEIIRYLHDKDLAIIRESEDKKPETDYLFYLYREIDEVEIKERYINGLTNDGIIIIGINDLLKEVNKQNKKLISEVSIDEMGDYLLYNLFGFLLYIRIILKEIQNIAYSKGLTKIAYIIVKDEENIAYEFSQYLLKEHNYDKGLEKDVLDIINNKNRFIEYYKVFKEKIGNGKIDKGTILEAYSDLKEFFIKNN